MAQQTPPSESSLHRVWWTAFSAQMPKIARGLPADCTGAIQFLISGAEGGLIPYFVEVNGRRARAGSGLCKKACARVRIPEANLVDIMLGEPRRVPLTMSGDMGLLAAFFGAFEKASGPSQSLMQMRSAS